MIDTLKAHLISDKTVRADITADRNQVKLEELKTKMSSIPGKISTTMDGWTSKNILSFLAIRFSY